MEACEWAWEHEAGLVGGAWRLGKGQLCGRPPEWLQRSESQASDCGERPLRVWLPWPLLAMRAGRDTGRETRPHGHTWWGHRPGGPVGTAWGVCIGCRALLGWETLGVWRPDKPAPHSPTQSTSLETGCYSHSHRSPHHCRTVRPEGLGGERLHPQLSWGPRFPKWSH